MDEIKVSMPKIKRDYFTFIYFLNLVAYNAIIDY